MREAYQTERRQRALVRAAAGLALLIACFGLFGLAALAVAQRRGEVSLRKALGASVASIVGLFTRDFLKLVGLALVLALPLTYWGAHQWLQNFAYRIDLGPGIFLLAGGLVGAIALLTVGVQAFRAARIDPATTLRDE
ncbi:MAG: ABC transporter permease [Salinibacter sp.]